MSTTDRRRRKLFESPESVQFDAALGDDAEDEDDVLVEGGCKHIQVRLDEPLSLRAPH